MFLFGLWLVVFSCVVLSVGGVWIVLFDVGDLGCYCTFVVPVI